MKRKLLIITIICLLTMLALTACHDTPESTAGTTTGAPEPKAEYLVTFEDTPSVIIQSNLTLNERVEAGTVINFTMKVSDFYEGTPEVYAGEELLTQNEQGMYSFTVQADTVISVRGLTMKGTSITGTGTEDDPYLISLPADLVYIAEQVNASNQSYIYAYYSLERDIDCAGTQLAVIGDGSTDTAVFAGYFNGNGYTISNFTIETTATQYVGLFGVLQADVTGGGGGSIIDLHLSDFTVKSSVLGQGSFVGSLVGYNMGGTLWLCSAKNGTVTAYGDSNSFSYVGGLVGIQQAMDYDSYAYYSSMSYCMTDVDVNCNSGLIYAAGGLVGYLSESTGHVAASMNNCYAYGDVYGAMRSGGLVGYMAAGTSVVNSYSTGTVSAQTNSTDKVNTEDFCYAYAGGVVGYADPGSIISGCYTSSTVQAVAQLGGKYQVSGDILGFAGEPGEFDYGYRTTQVHNCYRVGGGFDPEQDVFDVLHWQELDWTFDEDGNPVVNLDDEDEDFAFTLKFVIDGTEREVELSLYMPMHFWYRYVDDNGMAAIPARMTAEEGSTRISYGYFFDAEYTLPIPAGFVPSHDMTIYAATADVADVIGTYEVKVSTGATVLLTLDKDGLCSYDDAGQTNYCGYIYDGETILFEEARFGRYSSDELELLNYQFYNFLATIGDDGTLYIVGGAHDSDDGYSTIAYFTERAPLVASPLKNALLGSYTSGGAMYTFYSDGTGVYETLTDLEELTYQREGDKLTVIINGVTYTGTVNDDGLTLDGKTLHALDAFVGSWHVDSMANKVYTFDGAGNWSYRYYGFNADGNAVNKQTAKYGTYTVDEDGKMTLSGDLNATAEIIDGVLTITRNGNTFTCHRDGGHIGTWLYGDYGMTLTLGGITADGYGNARIEYLYEEGLVEGYDLIYAIDELYSDRICLYYGEEIFGYLDFAPAANKFNATIYVGSMGTFMSNVWMTVVDDYKGEWIGEIDGMPALNFNGNGSYDNGRLTIGKDEVPYKLTEGTLNGSFSYNGVNYALSYNEEDGTITLTYGDGQTAIYRRKDAFGDLTLKDGKDNLYTFDGRDVLSGQGTMYVNGEAQYTYALNGDELILYRDGKRVGSITIDEIEREYKLNLDGEKSVSLRIRLAISRIWALSNSPDAQMTIGTMDLDGRVNAMVNGRRVTMQMGEDGLLSFQFPGYSTVFYVIPVGEKSMVISQYKDWYLYGDQIDCAIPDEMLGTWENALGGAYKFDGMADSGRPSQVVALAEAGSMAYKEFFPTTAFGYDKNDKGEWIMWTISSTTGEAQFYRLNFCSVDTKWAFVNADGTKAFLVEKGDRLYGMDACEDDSGITYSFDGFGKVTTSDGKTYDYTCISIDEKGCIAIAQISVDGQLWQATIDYSVAGETPSMTMERL